jgi:hypothetical protein
VRSPIAGGDSLRVLRAGHLVATRRRTKYLLDVGSPAIVGIVLSYSSGDTLSVLPGRWVWLGEK